MQTDWAADNAQGGGGDWAAEPAGGSWDVSAAGW